MFEELPQCIWQVITNSHNNANGLMHYEQHSLQGFDYIRFHNVCFGFVKT
jgi:hypothetical protein